MKTQKKLKKIKKLLKDFRLFFHENYMQIVKKSVLSSGEKTVPSSNSPFVQKYQVEELLSIAL